MIFLTFFVLDCFRKPVQKPKDHRGPISVAADLSKAADDGSEADSEPDSESDDKTPEKSRTPQPELKIDMDDVRRKVLENKGAEKEKEKEKRRHESSSDESDVPAKGTVPSKYVTLSKSKRINYFAKDEYFNPCFQKVNKDSPSELLTIWYFIQRVERIEVYSDMQI